jgi:hypothetical protein
MRYQVVSGDDGDWNSVSADGIEAHTLFDTMAEAAMAAAELGRIYGEPGCVEVVERPDLPRSVMLAGRGCHDWPRSDDVDSGYVTERMREIARELDRIERGRREREGAGNDAPETPRGRELRSAVAALQSIMDQLKAGLAEIGETL